MIQAIQSIGIAYVENTENNCIADYQYLDNNLGYYIPLMYKHTPSLQSNSSPLL